ncbi:hypothetical protein K437DRAFT_254090 [Tilletiaria anomala UBC 951]|uniref:Uncharacterized protein n=1 Tax=Tilletiaria anomala (strain ATCC 24038 / CBS 436.72 / UBC 951) TaxID=1037660 RepID=A0A066WEX8_TILAU|nr:uncharacterized protein K437DRAFT_254090 [Tilletiaria anomala UBC 951]KDN52507.1 hypothetical protein K437DRAFT_254090 [Tilletiaria anomala UBC 951]
MHTSSIFVDQVGSAVSIRRGFDVAECKGAATPASNMQADVDLDKMIKTTHFNPAVIGSLPYLAL